MFSNLRSIVRTSFVVLVSFAASTVMADKPANPKCPVIPDRNASADIKVEFKGKDVCFCCNECKSEFLENPELYESEVPQLQELSAREQVAHMFDANMRFIIVSALATVLLASMVYRRWRMRSVATKAQPVQNVEKATSQTREKVGWMKSLATKNVSPVFPLSIAAAILGFEVYSLRQERELTNIEENMHFATFYDFGYPPVPIRPDFEPRVQATFYRGNDERSPRLFNNGNYRTGTFHVSVVDEDWNEVVHLEETGDRELFLALEIERPPYTPDFLYAPEFMTQMFLTSECDRYLGRTAPVSDRVDLEVVEPMQRWRARYPIGNLDGEQQTRGIVYVCQEYWYKGYWWSRKDDTRGGSRFHYAIQYDLSSTNGVLADTSDLWMGSLYRTRKFPQWKVPLDQWFSAMPIPELPYAGTDDPELLGITDYVSTEDVE